MNEILNRRILNYLVGRQPYAGGQIAIGLGASSSEVRQALADLVAEGKVREIAGYRYELALGADSPDPEAA